MNCFEKNMAVINKSHCVFCSDLYQYYDLCKEMKINIGDKVRVDTPEGVREFSYLSQDELMDGLDIAHPILLKNEFRDNIIKWLGGNLRDSACYGRDNKLYLYYENVYLLCVLLSQYDISDFIRKDRISFLIGENQLLQQLKLWNDDSNNNTFFPGELQLKEIKKLIYFWPWMGYSGNYFFDGIMDYHPNLLTIKSFGLSAFGLIYKELLKDKNIEEGIASILNPKSEFGKHLIRSEFDAMFGKSRYSKFEVKTPIKDACLNEIKKLLTGINKPSKLEWFKAIYLAYNRLMGRKFTSRLAPAIFFSMHTQDHTGTFYHVADCKKAMLDIYDQFDDLKVISVMRNQLTQLGSAIESNYHCDIYKRSPLWNVEVALRMSALYMNDDDPWLDKRAVVRFEDLKMFPHETTKALCQFLQIPWSDSLLHTTANGCSDSFQFAGINTSDFDLKPIYNLHNDYVGNFDYYRVEVLKGDYWKYWGYKTKFYDGAKFTLEQVKKMYQLPFKIEEYCTTSQQEDYNKQWHERIEMLVEEIYNSPEPIQPNGHPKLKVKWIKPNVPDEKLFNCCK